MNVDNLIKFLNSTEVWIKLNAITTTATFYSQSKEILNFDSRERERRRTHSHPPNPALIVARTENLKLRSLLFYLTSFSHLFPSARTFAAYLSNISQYLHENKKNKSKDVSNGKKPKIWRYTWGQFHQHTFNVVFSLE